MLKLGEKIISDIYLGDKKIAKVFLGDKLVYQAGKPIFLDYIEFDGASYIDTGIIGKSGISAEYNVYIPSSNIEKANVLLTGSRISSGDTRFYLGVVIHPYGKCWGLGIGTDYYQAKSIPTGDKYYYIQANTSSSGGELIVDGETVATTTATIDTGLNMYMGGVNNYGTPRLSGSEGLKFTYYKLYHDGTLIQDLRPCIDPKGTVCMYDMVTKKYFYNQGTGTLKAGGRFVESIIFDGASYINTGISYQDCTVECGLICPANSGRELMGWSSSASTYWGITNSQFELGGGFVLTKSDTTKYSEVEIEVAISDKRVLTLSHAGNSIKRTGGVSTGTYNYAIGAMPNTYSYGFIGNIYFHRFINPDGVLMQDLRPYVDENNVACFKDVVTGNLFYNQGTGTLGYTEE